MRSLVTKISVLVLSVLTIGTLMASSNTYADESDGSESTNTATSIGISPVSEVLQLEESKTYDKVFKVTNDSDAPMEFEVYAAPYSYTYIEEEDSYKLGFSKENSYTQIVRWITFKAADGNYVAKTKFTAEPKSDLEISYRISTPDSIPSGGQYAVLFAHALSGAVNSSGIKTEASPGLVIYGRSTGETKLSGGITNLSINNTTLVDGEEKTLINAVGKVKNTGNVDFMATGRMKVTGIFGQVYYETPTSSTAARISVIPETELAVSDTWKETPYFGLFNVEWTVTTDDDEVGKTITKFVIIMPLSVIIIIFLLLTITIVWIIIVLRKRKEHRSRFVA